MERVRIVDGEPTLVVGTCRGCGHATFPLRARCPSCRADSIDETTLGPDGRVEAAVELHVSTTECEAPYTLGLVALGGVTLLARISGGHEPGTPVRLATDSESNSFWFAANAPVNALHTSNPDD